MGLETNYNAIGDLNEAWPTGSEFKSFGDNHLRGIKAAVRKTFPGSTGAVVATGVDGGVVNTYTLTSAAPLPAYTARTLYVFTPPITNTGPATLNVSSLGPRAIKTVSGAPLMGGDLPAGIPVLAIDTGAELRLIAITKRYADNLAASGAFPDQSGSAGKVARTDGGSVTWEEVGAKGADVASAATLDLSSAVGDFRHVTGTTAITAITLPLGAVRTLVFDGALTLTNGAGLLLPGAANIVTAAGDRMIVRGDTAGAIVVSYTRASGQAVVSSTYAVTLLATLTPTAAANVDFLNVFSSAYDKYVIEFEGLTPSANDLLVLRMANGGVVDVTTNCHFISWNDSTVQLNPQNYFLVGGNVDVTAPNFGSTGTVEVRNANGANKTKEINTHSTFPSNGAGAFSKSAFLGAYTKAATVSGFRFYWLAGSNFAAVGTIRVYGHQN